MYYNKEQRIGHWRVFMHIVIRHRLRHRIRHRPRACAKKSLVEFVPSQIDWIIMSSTTATKRWPGEENVAHPEVFNIPPAFPKKLKPGQLSEEQFKQFFDEVASIIAFKFNTIREL